MSSSKYLASLVALVAIFVSFKFYSNPEVTQIAMSGPEMKAFESTEVLKHVKKMQCVFYLFGWSWRKKLTECLFLQGLCNAREANTSVRARSVGYGLVRARSLLLGQRLTVFANRRLHLVIWNSWKSAYYHADKYPKEDFANYAEYAWTAVEFLEGHHDAEEKALFPAIEKKVPGSMEKNEAQHESFLKPLVDLGEYVKSARDGKTQFDAKTYREQVDKILVPVMEHLAEELDTLKGSELLKHFTEDEIAVLNKVVHKAQQGDSHKNLPFILHLTTSNLICAENLPPNSPFPPAPAFVTKLLGPYVFYWKYSQLWKYATYPWKPTLPTSVPQTSL
ncbi:hypothetical protein V5O48_007415 [Marasmius crinis-equi]|uniref:Hemerythrin-like domain-containing protein n=1 Tax=Marasmius crinis-equi TaxID=585013 RepID=A0ABR3FGR3_9AGAR